MSTGESLSRVFLLLAYSHLLLCSCRDSHIVVVFNSCACEVLPHAYMRALNRTRVGRTSSADGSDRDDKRHRGDDETFSASTEVTGPGPASVQEMEPTRFVRARVLCKYVSDDCAEMAQRRCGGGGWEVRRSLVHAKSVGANVYACSASGDASASGTVAAAEERVLPVRVNGIEIGDFRDGAKQDEIVRMLKYHADARKYFKFPELTVSTTLESDGKRVHVVHVPAESGFISVELLHVLLGDEDGVFTPSGPSAIDCEPFDGTSVTHTGQLRMTSALIDMPAVRMSGGGLLQRILSHPVLSFLKGVDCILVEQRESSWIRVKLFDPKSPPEKLGIVVRRSNVRMVDLMFGKASIPMILRQDSGDSVSDAVKESCDWRAWPAVSACTEALNLNEATNVIKVSGVWNRED
jgi:hypothetical protein